MRIKFQSEKIVGYVRVSTDDRTSLDSQETQIRADADAEGQIVVRVFVGAGESGQNAPRPEFKRLLEFVEDPANDISEVKIVSPSRLSRDPAHLSAITARLKRANIRLHALSDSSVE